MNENLCLSVRPEQLSRWRQAFPAGTVVATLAALSRANSETILWLHAGALPLTDLKAIIAEARKTNPRAKFVVISGTPAQPEALTAFNAGAAGYCHAMATPQMLRQVATVVTNGGMWLGPELLDRIIATTSRIVPPQPETPSLASLTAREKEVALAVGRGLSNREVAELLEISERTVKAHLGAIFEKLQVRDRLQLALLLGQG